MPIKTYRTLEVLRQVYPKTRGISSAHEITADTVLIEPLRFTMADDNIIEELEQVPAKKVLVCSEFAMLRLPPAERRRILAMASAITANCEFQARLFRYIDVKVDGLLCDPIPDNFCLPASPSRSNSVVACGNIAPNKNSEGVIEVFRALEGVCERVYVGSASLWGSGNRAGDKLQQRLYAVCDRVVEDATPSEVAVEFQQAKVGFWCAYHDCFATSVHEMLKCGVPVISAPHGLSQELPVVVGNSIAEQVDKIGVILDSSDDEYAANSQQLAAWGEKRASYQTFQQQFQGVLRKIWQI